MTERARRNTLWGILLAVGIAWIYAGRVPPGTGPTKPDLPPAPVVGHPAPDFALTTLTGETFTLSALQGTPIVLNFWATWCPPCRAELPELQSASQRLAGQIAVAGVDQAEPAAAVQDFADRLGVSFTVPLDGDTTASHLYGVRSLPTTFFIDRAGIIRQIQVGPVTEATLTQLLGSIYP